MIVSVLIHWYYVAAFRQQCNAPLMGNTHVTSGEYIDSVQASHSPEDLSLHTHICRLPIHHSYYFSLYFLMYKPQLSVHAYPPPVSLGLSPARPEPSLSPLYRPGLTVCLTRAPQSRA